MKIAWLTDKVFVTIMAALDQVVNADEEGDFEDDNEV